MKDQRRGEVSPPPPQMLNVQSEIQLPNIKMNKDFYSPAKNYD